MKTHPAPCHMYFWRKVVEALELAPFETLLGMKVIQIERGFCRIELPFRLELTQPAGIVHGGAIASLADTAVAVALKEMVIL